MDERRSHANDRPWGTATPLGPLDRRALLRSTALLGGGALLAPRVGGRTFAAPVAQEPTQAGTYRVLTNEQFGTLDPRIRLV